MLSTFAFLASLGLAAALPPQQPLPVPQAPVGDEAFGASTAAARANANYVFNAIHASMRQWDSSLQHNGMSYFLATVPEGTLLYHGTHTPERVKGLEWLAFEIEHAENFARTRRPRPPKDPKDPDGPGNGPPSGPGKGPPGPGRRPDGPLHGSHFSDKEQPGSASAPHVHGEASAKEEVPHGYLHIYQANRDLSRLLYIDGMSAGKTSLGTLDSTDNVLVNITREGTWPEQVRAEELCQLGKEWNIEGIVRMEAGFEIIFCDFEDGLDLVSAPQRPIYMDEGEKQNPEAINDLEMFEYSRALAIRYHGIDGDRVKVDYSSMQSLYFYPFNLTNPDVNADQTLPRLLSAEPSQVSKVKDDLKTILSRSKARSSINWQGIVDLIVTRYADRLQYLSAEPSVSYRMMLSEINAILNTFIDYREPPIESSMKTCTEHFLRPAKAFDYTEQDELISAAIETVTGRICRTLFDARKTLLDESSTIAATADSDDDRAQTVAGAKAASLVRDLMDWLNWPVWKNCKQCNYDQVCYVAIWPWGSEEDHYSPRCKNNTEISWWGKGRGYWNFGH